MLWRTEKSNSDKLLQNQMKKPGAAALTVRGDLVSKSPPSSFAHSTGLHANQPRQAPADLANGYHDHGTLIMTRQSSTGENHFFFPVLLKQVMGKKDQARMTSSLKEHDQIGAAFSIIIWALCYFEELLLNAVRSPKLLSLVTR